MFKDLVLKNRSYRKFYNDKKVSIGELTQLIELARNTPSSKNKQPLKYLLITSESDVNFVEDQLKWAKFLTNWDGPNNKEQPPAYIIMLLDKTINEQALIDAGIAAQTILLGAVEKHLGGCIIRSVNITAIINHFNLSSNLEIVLVIAIGYPNQVIELTEPADSTSINYYEDDSGTHYVPKRKLQDIIILNKTSQPCLF